MFIVNSMFIRQIWYLNHHMALPLPYHVIRSMIGLSITCVGVESLFISRIDIQWRIQVQSNSISLNSQKPRSPYSNIIIQISNKMSKTRLIALIGAQYSKIQVDIIRWKVVRQVDVQWRNWLSVRLVTGAKKMDFTKIKILDWCGEWFLFVTFHIWSIEHVEWNFLLCYYPSKLGHFSTVVSPAKLNYRKEFEIFSKNKFSFCLKIVR